MLLGVFADAPVVLAKLALAEAFGELEVVRDDDQLEVGLPASRLHDFREGVGERVGVWGVEVGGGLVEGQDAAVQAKGFCQGEADDEAREYFLAGGASASHLELCIAAAHDDAVVVGPPAHLAARALVANDGDGFDVLPAVRLLPELLDDFVDFRHLGAVKRHERLVERGVVLVEVGVGELGGAHLEERFFELVVDVRETRVRELLAVFAQVLLVHLHRAARDVVLVASLVVLAPRTLHFGAQPLLVLRPHHRPFELSELRGERLRLHNPAPVRDGVLEVALPLVRLIDGGSEVGNLGLQRRKLLFHRSLFLRHFRERLIQPLQTGRLVRLGVRADRGGDHFQVVHGALECLHCSFRSSFLLHGVRARLLLLLQDALTLAQARFSRRFNLRNFADEILVLLLQLHALLLDRVALLCLVGLFGKVLLLVAERPFGVGEVLLRLLLLRNERVAVGLRRAAALLRAVQRRRHLHHGTAALLRRATLRRRLEVAEL
mmetsp:Transcript_10613/g.34835  ORF Transcript_10613/g.34835 Transcript_10613/m.34835 type:complete len:492 (+) Transcript_10613:211-1686(+)